MFISGLYLSSATLKRYLYFLLFIGQNKLFKEVALGCDKLISLGVTIFSPFTDQTIHTLFRKLKKYTHRLTKNKIFVSLHRLRKKHCYLDRNTFLQENFEIFCIFGSNLENIEHCH